MENNIYRQLHDDEETTQAYITFDRLDAQHIQDEIEEIVQTYTQERA